MRLCMEKHETVQRLVPVCENRQVKSIAVHSPYTQGCQSGIFISQFWELWGMSGKSLGIGLFLGIFGNIEKNWEILAKFRDFLIF